VAICRCYRDQGIRVTLILGATGMLGRAMMDVAAERGLHHAGASSTDADFRNPGALERLLEKTRPDTVINCAALTDIARCEVNPCEAYVVNAQAVARMAVIVPRLIQISTDHFWTGDKRRRHQEYAPIRLVNEYARTKWAGERFALATHKALVVRTNIVGERNTQWLREGLRAEGLEAKVPLTLYDDFITSPIDVRSFSEALLDLPEDRQGILNLAGREPVSKYEFGQLLADAMGYPMTAKKGSVNGMKPKRAESLGLDVTRAEKALGRALPTPRDVAEALV
jgi:dTDP-4-dehydrorhamnose reductase